MTKRNSIGFAIGLATCGILISCGGKEPDDVTDPSTSSTSQDLWIEPGRFPWPDGVIPVCFATDVDSGEAAWFIPVGTAQHEREAKFLRRTLRKQWGRVADIHFRGWNVCPSLLHQGMVGAKFFTYEGGQATMGPAWPAPLFAKLGAAREPFKLYLHEFGHVLGFQHEFDRTDFPGTTPPCNPPNNDGGTRVTPPDPLSIMTQPYCGPGYGLSRHDIAGVRQVYGRKRAAIAVTGGSNWDTVPIAIPTGNRTTFSAYNTPAAQFALHSKVSGNTLHTGDFDSDSRTGGMLLGPGIMTVGNFRRKRTLACGTNCPTTPLRDPEFLSGESNFVSSEIQFKNSLGPSVVRLIGDFDGDGRDDVALTGPSNWNTIPVALSSGVNQFRAYNRQTTGFTAFPWCSGNGALYRLVGDYNGDGRSDILLIGSLSSGWNTMPVALANEDGTFTAYNNQVEHYTSFVFDVHHAGASPFVGDFNDDGNDDILLVGGSDGFVNWTNVRIAYSRGDGTFWANTAEIPGGVSPNTFADWAREAYGWSRTFVADFDGDGFKDDILLTGVSGWNQVRLAIGQGNGSFVSTPVYAPYFGTWSATAGVRRIVADFDGDGAADVALTGVSGWQSIPVFYSANPTVDTGFEVINSTLTGTYNVGFGWAASVAPKIMLSHYYIEQP